MDSSSEKRHITLQKTRDDSTIVIKARKGFFAKMLGINAGPLSAKYEVLVNGNLQARVLARGTFKTVLTKLKSKGDEDCIRLLRESASVVRDPERSETKWFSARELKVLGILWFAPKTYNELKVLACGNGIGLRLCMSALESSGLVVKRAPNGSEAKFMLSPQGESFINIVISEDLDFANKLATLQDTVINENKRQL